MHVDAVVSPEDTLLSLTRRLASFTGMNNQRALDEFAAATASFTTTMDASLTYIARVGCSHPHIIKARLNFHGEGTDIAPKRFASSEIVAERFPLSALGLTPGDVVKAALDGKIATPGGEYAFLPQITGGYVATFIPLHPEVLAHQSRTAVLQIRGTDQSDHWENHVLDWALRSADAPYDNLNELSIDFGIGA
jgi:hypothetical protein